MVKNYSIQHHINFIGVGIVDFKGLASNLALNVSTRNRFVIPNKTYLRQEVAYYNCLTFFG